MRTALDQNGKTVYFYCFDADNVVVGKAAPRDIEGEITGKKGDAFRFTLALADTEKTKKVEVRPVPKK